MQNTKVLDYNFDSKYIVTVNGKIYFENLVIAEGMTKAHPSVKFAEEDAEEFDFHIDNVPYGTYTFMIISDSYFFVSNIKSLPQ